MRSRRYFLFSLPLAIPLVNCASLPADVTRRAGGAGDSTTGTSPVWRPEPAISAEPPAPAPKPSPIAGDRYTCPMHPEIDQATPGECPKCGMDLVLKKTGGSK